MRAQLPLLQTFRHYFPLLTPGSSSSPWSIVSLSSRHPLYVLLKKKKKKIGKRKRERKKEKRSPEPLFQRLRSSDFFFPLPLDSPIEWTIYADAFTAVHGWRQGALFSCMQAAYRRFDVPSPGIGTENCNVGADNVSPNDRYRPYRNTGWSLIACRCFEPRLAVIPLSVTVSSKGVRLRFTPGDSTKRHSAKIDRD